MSKRSQKIILTNEALVLRALRQENKLSMRAAGTLIGVSDSTIAHIETGRMNPPTGATLERFFSVYGNIKLKSYQERVRIWKAKHSSWTGFTQAGQCDRAAFLRARRYVTAIYPSD